MPRIKDGSMSTNKREESNDKQLTGREKLVYELLKKNGALARKDIEDVLKLKRSQSGDLLKAMKDKHLIVMIGNGRNSKYGLVNR